MSGSKFESVSGVLFDGLTAQNTTVGALRIDAECSTHSVSPHSYDYKIFFLT